MAQRILKLRGDQERRRFLVGVSIDAPCQKVCAVLVAATGRGLEARFEISNHVMEPIAADITAAFVRLSSGTLSAPTDAALLSARLAEVQGGAIQSLAAIEQDVWPRVLLCGVNDPGLWRRDVSPPDYFSLCDSARLAELIELNIVDAFPARDVAQEGNGRALDAVPTWLAWHHPGRTRLLLHYRPILSGLLLPASRDESGVLGVQVFDAAQVTALLHKLTHAKSNGSSPMIVSVNSAVGLRPDIEEILLLSSDGGNDDLPPQLAKLKSLVEFPDATSLGLETESHRAVCAAIHAMLHIDQVPANLPPLTGASAPRVLGRLTPGDARAWNRLLRDLAFARPLITPLRAAV